MKIIDNTRDLDITPEVIYINLDDDKRIFIGEHFMSDILTYFKDYLDAHGSDLPDDGPAGYVGINALNAFQYLVKYAEENDIDYELGIRIFEDEDTPHEQVKVRKFVHTMRDDGGFIFDPMDAIGDRFSSLDENNENVIDDNMYIPVKCTFAKTLLMNKKRH